MLRIILSLCFFVIFAFADSCDFSNSNQKDCEIDINNPPILLHKFIDKNDNVSLGYGACIYDGKLEIYDEEYDVINCSMAENNDGFLTEGVIFANMLDSKDDINYKLTTNKNIELKDNNIILRVAGDFVLDSGIRINTKNPKKFILEVIEGSNGKSNIILQRGSKLGATSIFMPDGENSTIRLNTFFGGIYEKDFINMIDDVEQIKRGNMETIINVDNIYSITQDGESINLYNGNLICGPEVNPLDLSNNQYILKRLYNIKSDSKDAPNDENSICEVKEGGCFDKILSYNDIKIYEKNYKIATTKLDIVPSYGIFIESGKIYSQDGSKTDMKNILSNAKILSQHNGKCGAPTKLAFSQEAIDMYNDSLAQGTPPQKIEIEKSQEEEIIIAQNEAPESLPQDSTQSEQIDSQQIESIENQENIEIVETTKSLPQDSIDSQESTEIQTAQEEAPQEIEIAKSKEEPIIQEQKSPPYTENMQKRVDTNDDFLIVEQENFDNSNKICNENLQCIRSSLLPYDKVIWNKLSSKNKTNSIYILNLTNNNLNVTCDVMDYYGENLKFAYNLNSDNLIGKITLRFPESDNKAHIICKSANTEKQTNNINVTPAKFSLNPNFKDSTFESITTLKAGAINIIFEGSKALNLEGEIDSGFNGNLTADSNNLEFKQKNKCSSQNKEIFMHEPMKISFKNGKVVNDKAEFIANTITNGKLNINFDIENNNEFCSKNNNPNMPKCINANISKDINIIPANFMIRTDIISPYKLSYYGQIEDRNTFKYNPLLDIRLNALNNKDEIIDINQSCNYGSVQLSLDSDLLVEFKRSVSDRLNSKINIYLDEFDNKQTANLKVYFGIAKITDNYKNSRKIKQNDLIEPQEIKLTDLKFNAKFKNGSRFYDYNNLVVYDRLTDDSTPLGVMIARGKIQPNNNARALQEGKSMVIKYEIYCETCDTNILAKYLNVEDVEMDGPNWYINTKHPSDLYISDKFIDTNLEIKNSNKAFEGRQEIIFTNKNPGKYNVTIDQKPSGFAPYLNYNENFKNIYLSNSFIVVIDKESQSIKNENEPKIKEDKKESKKEESPKIESKKVESKKPESKMEEKPKQKIIEEPKAKSQKPKSPSSIQLDIEN